MAQTKQTSSSQTNRPGDRFFIILLAIGSVALIVLWQLEKPTRSTKKSQARPALVPEKARPAATPNQVLVMSKSNLPPNRVTNFVSVLTAQTQAVAPAVSNSNPIRTNAVTVSGFTPRAVQNVFEAQLELTRQGISAGSIDGVSGSQTRAALQAFQLRERLPLTGELDLATKAKLILSSPPYGSFVVSLEDIARLQPLGTDWLSKSKQDHLAYETVLEMVAEKACCSPNFIKQLNPSINWSNVLAGATLRVPIVATPKPNAPAAFVRISLAGKNLKAFDAQTNLIAHFPCSIAQKVEKRPVGALYVEKIATDPDYTFNPENFPESIEARTLKTKLILSPGPNNPVGSVWIGLNKPGYGIHGTPKPEDVGRTESHGCFRLANWNAEYLVRLVTVGTPILVDP